MIRTMAEYLEVQNFCQQQAAISIGNRKRKFEELQFENLRKGLKEELPPIVKDNATQAFKELKTKLGIDDYDNETLASFDAKYPGVYQKSWPSVNWDDIVLPLSIKEKLRNIGLIALSYFMVSPKNCLKGPKRSVFLYGVPGLKIMIHLKIFIAIRVTLRS